MRMEAGARGAIVAGKEYQRVIPKLLFIQFSHKAAKVRIQLGHVPPVGGVAGVITGVILGKLRRGRDGLMRLVIAGKMKERRGFVPPLAQPVDGFISNNPGRVTLEGAQWCAVAHKIPRVVMVG